LTNDVSGKKPDIRIFKNHKDDAYRCFMRTEMDYLVMGEFLFDKTEQGSFQETVNWQEEYVLD
jgi:hypothetical protein